MLKKISFFLLLLVGLLSGNALEASHYYGATFLYECMPGSVIRVYSKQYISCYTAMPPTPSIQFTGIGTCTAPVALTAWTFVSFDEVTMLAPTMVTDCNGGSIEGVKECIHWRDYDFSAVNCTQYLLQWSLCCRQPNLTNVTAATQFGLQTDTIDLSISGCNSSPVWRIPPPSYVVASHPNHFDHSAYDPDGDSLVYSFALPLDASLNPVPYNPGYSMTAPLGSGWDVKLDSESGLLSITSITGTLQNAAIVIKASEYRNGQLLGSVSREFKVMTVANLPCPNQLPVLSGPSNIQNATYVGNSLLLPPGGSMCVDFSATDLDLGDATQLSWMRELGGASLTDTFGSPPDTVLAIGPWARLCWTAPNAMRNDTVTITAIDSTCQLNNMVILQIPVTVGDTGDVWPGDANDDLIADAFDLLPIGLAYGNTGFVRPAASNTWVGQASFPWNDTLLGGLDKKYVDCDGSGTIDDDDTLAITLNYGLTHTKATLPFAKGTAVDPPFMLVLPDSADVGDTISAPIILGDASVPANNVYGYAFVLQYDASLIDSSTFWIDFNNSWLGNSSNALDISRNHEVFFACDGAQVRTTHTIVSGMGEVARAHFVIIDNIDGKRQTLDSAMLNIFFSNVRVIALNGEEVAVDVLQDSMVVYDRTTDVPVAPVASMIGIYPNPAQDVLTVSVEGGEMDALEVTTVLGQVVMRKTDLGTAQLDLQVGSLSNGLYFLRVHTELGWTLHRIVIE